MALSRFAGVKSKRMLRFGKRKRSVEDFERLARMLIEENAFRKKGADFDLLCSSFMTSRVELDNMLYDAVGMSGEDVLVHLRRRKPMIPD